MNLVDNADNLLCKRIQMILIDNANNPFDA